MLPLIVPPVIERVPPAATEIAPPSSLPLAPVSVPPPTLSVMLSDDSTTKMQPLSTASVRLRLTVLPARSMVTLPADTTMWLVVSEGLSQTMSSVSLMLRVSPAPRPSMAASRSSYEVGLYQSSANAG